MFKITFQDSAETFEVPAGTSFLEFCQAHDVPQAFGCTAGNCGVCCCRLIEGAENVNEMTDQERKTIELQGGGEDVRLACQLIIQGDIVVQAVDL